MNIIEALSKSNSQRVKREGWSAWRSATFFDGTRGKRLEIENPSIGMEHDPLLEDWFADDWLPVTPEPEKIKAVGSPTYQELEAENAELRKKLQSQDETSKLTELGKLILQLNKKAWEMREDL